MNARVARRLVARETALSSAEPYSGERLCRRYLFGEFTLDVEHRILWRAGEELPLRPKSFEVLASLVEHHGRLISRADLMEAVWAETAVTDNSLTQCIVEIRRALDDDSQQLIRTVARRGYLFTAQVTTPIQEFAIPPICSELSRRPLQPLPESQGTLSGAVRSSHRRLIGAVTLVIALVSTTLLGSVAWRVWRARENPEPLRAIPLNSMPGMQRYPSFSPDGNHVVFTWTGPKQDNQDVYVQQIGSGSPLRLTMDSGIDYNSVWSPDGRWIAFLRRKWEAGTSEVRLVPPLGGPERKVAEIRVRDTYYIVPPYQAWCPESNCLVVTDSPGEGKPAGLFVLSLETGEKRQLTYPQFPAIGDTNPAVSPDSNWLVFRRELNLHDGELYRLRLGRSPVSGVRAGPVGLTGLGEAQRLTSVALDAGYPTWIPGNKEILFSARRSLWRLVVSGKNTPARLPFSGDDDIMPVASRLPPGRTPRLAYVRSFQDANIWRVEFSAPGATASAPPVMSISSTRMDSTPQLSPQGRRVAFASDRSGPWEIWLADPDGSNAVQLTSMGADSGAPCWSPDGEQIVFQSNPGGQFDVYAIRTVGGKPRNLTSHPGTDGRPSFSRDASWIYFTSNRTGQNQIWKVPAMGGNALPVTNNVAFAAFESPDGAYLYYNERMETPSPLWRQPVSGGVPIKVLEGVVRAAFSVLDKGIYYIDRPSGNGGLLLTDEPSGETRLRYFDFATRRTATVARNLGNVFLGLTASKDGRTVFYSRVDFSMDELMFMDNFR
jgi:Tol biopolymer transport system component/DNA-binding winged helix-turn-helix (wHTH) protein